MHPRQSLWIKHDETGVRLPCLRPIVLRSPGEIGAGIVDSFIRPYFYVHCLQGNHLIGRVNGRYDSR